MGIRSEYVWGGDGGGGCKHISYSLGQGQGGESHIVPKGQ